MSDTVIRVENLSKRYHIGSQQQHKKRSQSLINAVTSPFRRSAQILRGKRKSALDLSEEFWALQDITFEVKKGEVLGIIGRNGAGKSTLLKILAGITLPTSGYAEVYGHVGSLLEVGTGFHPDLTGRENVYLNGAILGISRKELNSKFDEIVAFADINKFIDTPVKFYSSGMYVRLAFAVAAQLQPDILIVDEVLAVGDMAFQKKALGKVTSLTQSDRTVLFVSHNMNAIISICTKCILLDNGKLVAYGPTSEIASIYQLQLYSDMQAISENVANLTKANRYGSGKAQFTSIEVSPLTSDGVSQPVFTTGEDLLIHLKIVAETEIAESNVAVIIYDPSGYRLIDVNSASNGKFLALKPNEEAEVDFHLHNLQLKPDTYTIGLWLGRTNIEDTDGITYALAFRVSQNIQATKYPGIFPGPYQCHSSQTIRISGKSLANEVNSSQSRENVVEKPDD